MRKRIISLVYRAFILGIFAAIPINVNSYSSDPDVIAASADAATAIAAANEALTRAAAAESAANRAAQYAQDTNSKLDNMFKKNDTNQKISSEIEKLRAKVKQLESQVGSLNKILSKIPQLNLEPQE